MPPCALALGKLEVADPRGIRLQRKKGWWKGVGTKDGPGGQPKLRVYTGHCYSGVWGGRGVCAGHCYSGVCVGGGGNAVCRWQGSELIQKLEVGECEKGMLLNLQSILAFMHWSSNQHV